MSNAGLLLGLIAVGVADGALLAALTALLVQRRRRRVVRFRPSVAAMAPIDYRTLMSLGGGPGVSDGVPMAVYDRVVRIAGWAWILSTGIIVGAGGLWPDRQGAIFAIHPGGP